MSASPSSRNASWWLRFDGQNIAADRLGFFRFVEAAVEFYFRDGLGDACWSKCVSVRIPWCLPLQLDFSGAADLADKHEQRIIEFIHYPLLERNDGVVGDVDVFRAYFSAALGDVAEADAELVLQHLCARDAVERMHLERGRADEEARSAKLFLLVVIAQDVADILAEEALDALAELLHAIDVALVHLPLDAGARLEGRDLLIHFEIPGDVGHQILDDRKCLHGKDGDGLDREEARPCASCR